MLIKGFALPPGLVSLEISWHLLVRNFLQVSAAPSLALSMLNSVLWSSPPILAVQQKHWSVGPYKSPGQAFWSEYLLQVNIITLAMKKETALPVDSIHVFLTALAYQLTHVLFFNPLFYLSFSIQQMHETLGALSFDEWRTLPFFWESQASRCLLAHAATANQTTWQNGPISFLYDFFMSYDSSWSLYKYLLLKLYTGDPKSSIYTGNKPTCHMNIFQWLDLASLAPRKDFLTAKLLTLGWTWAAWWCQGFLNVVSCHTSRGKQRMTVHIILCLELYIGEERTSETTSWLELQKRDQAK